MPQVRSQTTGTFAAGSTLIAYKIFRSARRRRTVAFQMESASNIRILAPLRLPLSAIDALVQKKLRWIVDKARSGHVFAPQQAQKKFARGDNIIYMGRNYRLSLTFDRAAPRGCVLRPHRLTVNLHDAGLSPAELREEVRLEILLWMKKRARVKFTRRLDLWASAMGAPYRKMLLSDPRRRWGSCNSKNVIRLNWRLIMAPLPLLDYVLAHELAHVRHKDHSPRFWSFLARVMPDYKLRQKELDRISHNLTL